MKAVKVKFFEYSCNKKILFIQAVNMSSILQLIREANKIKSNKKVYNKYIQGSREQL